MTQPNAFSLRIDKELINKLKELAQDNGRSLNKEIEFILKQHVKNLEKNKS